MNRAEGVLLGFFVAMSVAGTASADTISGKDIASKSVRSPAVLHVANADIKIHFANTLIYVSRRSDADKASYKDLPGILYLFKSQLPVEYKGRLAVENHYCKINGDTEKVTFLSSDPKVLSVSNGEQDKDAVKQEAGVIEAWAAGTATITASCKDQSVAIAFTIIMLPVGDGTNQDDVIKAVGLPDKQTKKFIEWPDDAIVDGIFYETRGRTVGMSVEHWHYDKYQDAIFDFTYGLGTSSIARPSWDKLDLLKYTLEHNN